MKKILSLILCFVFITSFSFALTKEDMMSVDYNLTKFYPGDFSSDILRKVRTFDENAEWFLEYYDDYEGYKNHSLTQEEIDLYQWVLLQFPPQILKTFKEKVNAVYFVEGMIYAALTVPVFDEHGELFCNIFVNKDTFKINMSEWNEYRDNSILKETDENNKFKVECSEEYPVLLQILLHEAVHVYDYVNNITPDLFGEVQKERKDSQFFKVWKNNNQPVSKYRNKKFEKTGYYEFGKKLPAKEGKKIVEYLAKTPFSTLYGAKNWNDDFAEIITSYWLLKKYGINYRLSFIQNGKETAVYSYKDNEYAKMWLPMCEEVTGK